MSTEAAARTSGAAELHAEPAWRVIDVLSDVHLSPVAPATFDAWAAHLRYTQADAVVLLGDLFEVWVGDDARGDAFEAGCIEVLRLASASRRLFFMAGNRDFLVGDDALEACGMQRLVDPTTLVAFGRRLLLTHGDAWYLADVDYQRFRGEVRSADWQRQFLARPLEQRRRLAREMRDASQAHQRSVPAIASMDIDRGTAVRELHRAVASTLIHGHTHRPGHDVLAPGMDRYVTSDWDFDDGNCRGDVLRISSAGIERLPPQLRP